MIKKVGQYIKHFRGAYKYAITQTFAIPTIDDAEKNTTNQNDIQEDVITENGGLNENQIENILGDPDDADFNKLFSLDENIA